MTLTMLAWLFAIPLLGFCTGLRTMMPMAIGCWFVYKHNLPVPHGWAFWITYPVTRYVFTALAIGELIGDKLPMTPNRTAPFPLAARLIFGGLIGALAATGLQGSLIEGIILGASGALLGASGALLGASGALLGASGALLGASGALLGAFLGMHTRRLIVQRTGWPDWPVALAEDAFAIVASVYAMGIVTG